MLLLAMTSVGLERLVLIGRNSNKTILSNDILGRFSFVWR